jgi:hypothetical protein
MCAGPPRLHPQHDPHCALVARDPSSRHNGGRQEDAALPKPLPRRRCEHEKTRHFQRVSSMDLTGVLSNHDLQGSLGRLAKKLRAVRVSNEPRRQPTTCRLRPRRPGWVLPAIVEVLTDRKEPMRAKDIHAAVETMLGESVARSSVKDALASNVSGESPRFVRIARGRYVLAGS